MFIDFRSDTVTTPNLELRQAMFDSIVGDDVYGDDETANALETLASNILGKEDGLFIPSGTMGNQLAILSHTNRGDEIVCGANSHIVTHEVGAPALLSGVNVRTIHNSNDFIYSDDIVNAVRPSDIHEPFTSLLCLENALSNGTVIPIDIMQQCYNTAKQLNLNVHLDGARIFNASTFLDVDVKEITNCCDSVTFCLSKGLGAPIGSVLCGNKKFIAKARKYRKALGGGMRQVGVIASPGIVALNQYKKTILNDHVNATYLANKLSNLKYVSVDLSTVHINMVFFKINKDGFDPDDFIKHLLHNNIKSNGLSPDSFRFVTHKDITKDNIDYAIDIINKYLAL